MFNLVHFVESGYFCRPNVERYFDLVASVLPGRQYWAKATPSTLSTLDKVGRVEFDFVASVYRAVGIRRFLNYV